MPKHYANNTCALTSYIDPPFHRTKPMKRERWKSLAGQTSSYTTLHLCILNNIIINVHVLFAPLSLHTC